MEIKKFLKQVKQTLIGLVDVWAIALLLTETEGHLKMSIVICLHHIKWIWIGCRVQSTHGVSAFAYLPKGPARSVSNISVLCATENGFSKTCTTWCPGNSWLCTVHLPYLKIFRPVSSLSGKTCKRMRNHEAGGSRK